MSFVRACNHALVKIRDRVQTETLIFPIQIWSTFSDKKNIIHCRKSIKITICKTEMIFFVNNLLRFSLCSSIYIHQNIFPSKYSMKIRPISYFIKSNRFLEILLCTKLNLFSFFQIQFNIAADMQNWLTVFSKRTDVNRWNNFFQVSLKTTETL